MKLPPAPTPLVPKEIASFYRVSVGTVLNWARSGKIPCLITGRVYRFPNPQALQLCLEEK